MISIAVWNLPAIVGNCRLRSRDQVLQAGFCQDLRLVQPVCPLVPSDARKILLLSCLCGFPGQVRINLSLCLNLCCGYKILTHLLHLQGENSFHENKWESSYHRQDDDLHCHGVDWSHAYVRSSSKLGCRVTRALLLIQLIHRWHLHAQTPWIMPSYVEFSFHIIMPCRIFISNILLTAEKW